MQKTQLRTSPLGRTGLEITRVGFGAWAIGGGGWEFGWGPQQDDESIAAIHRALELGVNWIDTAAAYGFGRSEQVVGRALQGVSERPYVFTKSSLLSWAEEMGYGHQDIAGLFQVLAATVAEPAAAAGPGQPAGNPAGAGSRAT